MAASTYPDGSPRTVDDNEYEILGSAWSSDGVIGSPADAPIAYADSTGLQVKIRANRYAIVHGHGWSSGTTDIIKTTTSNSSGQPRVDALVLGLDRTTQLVTEYVKQGTPAVSPSAPAMQRDPIGSGGKFEIPLAVFTVTSGASTVAASDCTAIAPYVLSGSFAVPDEVALNRVPTPIIGTVATMTNSGLQMVLTSGGWRRVDWNTSWGLIGGSFWSPGGSGATMVGGIGGSETYLGMSTPPISVQNGRRYQLRCKFKHVHTYNGAVAYYFFRENSMSGTFRGGYSVGPLSAGLGYEDTMFGEWNQQGDASKSFLFTGYNFPSGTMDIQRPSTDEAVIELIDTGPWAGLLAGPY